ACFVVLLLFFSLFSSTAAAPPALYTLSLHDALPILPAPFCSAFTRAMSAQARSRPFSPSTASNGLLLLNGTTDTERRSSNVESRSTGRLTFDVRRSTFDVRRSTFDDRSSNGRSRNWPV